MFEPLQQPPRSPERTPLGAGVSIAVHAALVLALVTVASPALAPPSDLAQSIIEAAIRYLLPPDQKGALGDGELTKWTSAPAAVLLPAEKGGGAVANDKRAAQAAPPKRVVEELSVLKPLAEEAAEQRAFTLLDVDSTAARDPTSAVPLYPAEMERRGIEGRVVVRFVVDTTGRADIETFRIIEASHPLFAAAVREALPRMKFRPAAMGNMRVRQLVELPFGFHIRPTDGSDLARRPPEYGQ
jgi:TonB family protein